MNESSEEKFLQALEVCKSLVGLKCQPSLLPCQAIELFCEVAEEPLVLRFLSEKYSSEIQKSLSGVYEYATTVDNWRIKECHIGFGVKDHCSILSFFLSIQSQKFTSFTGNWTPEVICDFLNDWKGLDLKGLLSDRSLLSST